jgi:hypothetical protein
VTRNRQSVTRNTKAYAFCAVHFRPKGNHGQKEEAAKWRHHPQEAGDRRSQVVEAS